MKYLKELEKTQWWPRDKILELQNQRLRQLIRHAYNNVPYYRRIFEERALKPDDIASSRDLAKLPILTKELIRKNSDQLMARGFPAKEVVPGRTGGSTGEPLAFYSTREEQHNWAIANRRRTQNWWGYKIGDKRVEIMQRHPNTSVIEKLRQLFERRMVFEAIGISQKLPFLVKKLEEFQPEFMVSYPSFIYLLARFMESQGKPKFRLKAITTVSEQLYEFQKELFKKVFGCEVYSYYGSFEMHQIAVECSEHSGYHIAAESVIIEVVNDEGVPVSVGEEGRIIITNLHNCAMPFIRYDIGDVGLLSSEICPCGRGLPLLARIVGRTTDFLITRNGNKIPSIAIPWEFLASEGVEQFQIVQESYGDMIVKIVLTETYQKEHVDQLSDRIMDQFGSMVGDGMNVTVEFVDQIPATRDGKRRVVVSNLPDSS